MKDGAAEEDRDSLAGCDISSKHTAKLFEETEVCMWIQRLSLLKDRQYNHSTEIPNWSLEVDEHAWAEVAKRIYGGERLYRLDLKCICVCGLQDGGCVIPRV